MAAEGVPRPPSETQRVSLDRPSFFTPKVVRKDLKNACCYIVMTDTTCKLTYCRSPNEAGRRSSDREPDGQKRADNVRRAKTAVLDIGQSNQWQYMATFTSGFEDPAADIRKLPKFLMNWNQKHGASIRYLLVYELGERGSRLHAHALLSGVPDAFIHRFQSSEYRALPPDLKRLYSRYKAPSGGSLVGTCESWKAGWSTLVPVDGSPRCVSYLTKYLTKSDVSLVTAFGGHAYFASHGLKRPKKCKIPADIASAVFDRVPAGAWYKSFLGDDGGLLSCCYVFDADKVDATLWSYYSTLYSELQSGQ